MKFKNLQTRVLKKLMKIKDKKRRHTESLILNSINSINHLSIILDGNKRWAKNKKIPIIDAYSAGIQNVLNISKELIKKN